MCECTCLFIVNVILIFYFSHGISLPCWLHMYSFSPFYGFVVDGVDRFRPAALCSGQFGCLCKHIMGCSSMGGGALGRRASVRVPLPSLEKVRDRTGPTGWGRSSSWIFLW